MAIVSRTDNLEILLAVSRLKRKQECTLLNRTTRKLELTASESIIDLIGYRRSLADTRSAALPMRPT